MINSEEDPTFFTILEIFYAKAEHMKSKLDFMLNITDNINEHKDKLEVPENDFIETKPRDQAMRYIAGGGTRSFLIKKSDLFNQRQTTIIPKLNEEICSFMAFKSVNKYDNFIGSFEQWVHKSTDTKHVQQVENNLESMKSKFNEFHQKFNYFMITADKLRASIKTDIASVNSLYENLSKTRESKTVAQMTEKVEWITDIVVYEQTNLIATLRNVICVLFNYNEQRITWAEFLIGMRNSPTSK